MQKAVVAYIVLLVLILLVGFIILPGQSLLTHSSTTTAAGQSQTNNSATNTTITTTIPLSTCESQYNITHIYNGNFSLGTYGGWNTTGLGWGTAPLNITYANNNSIFFNSSWSNYGATFFATTFHGLTLQPGNITSWPFKVILPYLNFQIISPQNANLYLQLLKDGKPVLTTHYDTYAVASAAGGNSRFVNASLPVSVFLCQNIQIRVVSGVLSKLTTSNEYIAVGNFYLSKTPVSTPGIIVNQSIS